MHTVGNDPRTKFKNESKNIYINKASSVKIVYDEA